MLEMIWLADRRLMIFIILAPLVVPFAGCMSDQAAKELGDVAGEAHRIVERHKEL